ncbi:MAG: GreA/GreB family elongation factor [Planctomycetota bacterium]
MNYDALLSLAKARNWVDLEKQWMTAVEQPDANPGHLLPVIDFLGKAGNPTLADTMGWAWLAQLKENRTADEALTVGRELLVHLTDGDQLRDEILELYKRTHADRADLDQWIERSGLKSGKSVRRALRFLDVALELKAGTCLVHRTEDAAAQILEMNLESDEIVVKQGRREQTYTLSKLVDEFDAASETDFRVLQQLNPGRISQLASDDPVTLAIGILSGHQNKMIRENIKLLLCPRYLPTEKWSDWWTKLRNEIKKTPNLRIEGRSPVFLVFDPIGQTIEQESWEAFSKAGTPREWLEILETYLRDTKAQKKESHANYLDRVQKSLVDRLTRFVKHKEPAQAFATALVIERVAADGLPVSTDGHGLALKMLAETKDPVAMVAQIPDIRLWSMAIVCVEQAFPDQWPEYLAQLILYAPSSQCDSLAKKVEKAGRGELLPQIAQQAMDDSGRFTDALMWLWKGPETETNLGLPGPIELFNNVMMLVGPARSSTGKAAGHSINEMRAKVRTGLSHRDYARFRECIANLEDSMAQTIRRLVERGDGLGPSLQDDMDRILRTKFAHLYARPKVALWDDDSVLYFTTAGLRTKENELAEIVNVKMRENAKAIGEAAAHGDLSENSEYKFALEERDLLRARVAKLNREISMAKVLEKHEVPSDFVSIGQCVVIKPMLGGASIPITILGFDEADLANHVYSYHSPFARNLLGKKPGDTVMVALDDDTAAEFAIESLSSVIQ